MCARKKQLETKTSTYTSKRLFDFYQMYEDGEDRTKTYGYKIRDFFVKGLVAGSPSRSVLDIGCGHGDFLASLKEPVKPKVGIDIVRVPLKDAKQKPISVVLADAHLLPFRSHTFQLVTAREVLEHLVAPQDALKEWMRVSSESIIISCPVKDGHRTCNAALFVLWKLRSIVTQAKSQNLSYEQRLSKESGHIALMPRRQILNLASVDTRWRIAEGVFFLKTPLILILDNARIPKQVRKLALLIEIAVPRIPRLLAKALLFEGFATTIKLSYTKRFPHHANGIQFELA